MPLSVAAVKRAAPAGDPGSTRGAEVPKFPRSPPLVPPYEAANWRHTTASLGSRLPTAAFTDTGHKESKIGFEALPVEFIHVVAQVKLQIFCVFKLTCGKGPCWNQGHWSGDLWFQESLSIDQCPQDNMSCPKTSHNRVSMTIDQLKNSMNACSRNTGERHTFRGSQERSFSLSNG